jgi:hypothetical protein
MRPMIEDFLVNNTKQEIKYYTISSYAEYSDDNDHARLYKDCNKVFAKSIQERLGKDAMSPDTPQTKYYIRGTNGKELFDPFPKYSLKEKGPSFIDKVCKDSEFIQVTKIVFDKYITFLNTQSKQYFISAQREIM